MFYAIAATIGTINWSRSHPFRIALAAMAPNIVAIGFCDRLLPLLQLVWGELGIWVSHIVSARDGIRVPSH